MRFERFVGTPDKGKQVSHFDEIGRTTASQSSRADANSCPSEAVRHESFLDEYESLVKEVATFQAEMRHYSKAAFIKAQMGVRSKKLPERESLAEWHRLKHEMLFARDRLKDKLYQLTQRITLIKPMALQERKALHEGAEAASSNAKAKADLFREMWTAFAAQTALLTEIRDLLKARKEG